MAVEPLSNRRQAKCPLQCVQLGQARCSQYTEDKRAQQDQSSYLSISCSHGNMPHMFALTIQTFCRCSVVKTKPCWRHMLVTIHHTIPQLLTSMYKVFFVQKGSMLAKKDFFCTCWTCQLVSDSALHKGVSIWRISEIAFWLCNQCCVISESTIWLQAHWGATKPEKTFKITKPKSIHWVEPSNNQSLLIPGKYYLHLDEMKYLQCILLLLDVWDTRHDRHQCDVFTFSGAELLGLVERRSSRQKKILSKWRLLFVWQFAGHCEQYKTVHSADIKECTMCKRGRCWWAAFWDCDSFSSCCPTFWCIHTWCWLHLVWRSLS